MVFSFLAYAVGVGYFAGTRPNGAWRFFSWHPFLMLSGFVGCFGIAAATKKLGGYTNTKVSIMYRGAVENSPVLSNKRMLTLRLVFY
jgi:hypothetical protein